MYWERQLLCEFSSVKARRLQMQLRHKKTEGAAPPSCIIRVNRVLLLLEAVHAVQAVEVLFDHLLVLRRCILRQLLFELLAFRRWELTPSLGVLFELLGINLAVVRPGDWQAATSCWT